MNEILIKRLPTIEHHGDWHDRPIRWSVVGPGNELQKFSTRKEAEEYRRVRLRSATFAEAVKNYVQP
jgi:hypothetical protein